MRESNLKYKANITGIDPAAADMLKHYDWPGNVRELRNVIERAVLQEEMGVIQPQNIRLLSVQAEAEALATRIAPQTPSENVNLKDSERILIARALEKTGGNKTRAAALLGISRDVLRYRMKSLGVPDK